MFKFFTKEKSVGERVGDLQNESMGIVQSFSDMIDKLRAVNEKIDEDAQKATEERDALNKAITDLEKTKAQNEAIRVKIENIIS